MVAVIIAAFIVEMARGQDGAPYNWLGAIAGVAYLLAIVVLRVRGLRLDGPSNRPAETGTARRLQEPGARGVEVSVDFLGVRLAA